MAAKKSNRDRQKRPRDPLESVSLIGMVHLAPLPGSPKAAMPMADIIKRSVGEARLLEKAGFDAIIVENFGDAPFAAHQVLPETVAAMGIVADHLTRAVNIPLGVNVLRNDALSALAVAVAAGAAFIRVNVLCGTYATDQGPITGRARDLMLRRAHVAPGVRVAADVHVKHATPLSQPDIVLAAEETAYRGHADALIVSGPATGAPADLDAVRRVKAAVPDRPIWIGSGVTAQTVAECLDVADAVIVGTSLKRGGRTTAPLDNKRLRAFTAALRGRR
jgi:membrane complex biogenesis BtpA family protein